MFQPPSQKKEVKRTIFVGYSRSLLFLQLKKPNKIRLGNWESPVLSKEQLEYAATDAFASWYLYQVHTIIE